MPLRSLRAGEAITEDWIADLVDAVAQALTIRGAGGLVVTRSGNGVTIRNDKPTEFALVELNDTIQKNDKDKNADLFTYDHTMTNPWSDTMDVLPLISDPDQGLRLATERHLLYHNPAAGQWHPLPGVLFHLGKVKTSTISAGGSGTVEIYTASGATWSDASLTVTAYDARTTGTALPVDHRVYVVFHQQSKQWRIIDADPAAATITEMAKGHLAGTLSLGGSASVGIDLAINSTVSGTVTAYDSNSDFTGANGKHCMIVYNTSNSKWEFIWVAC